MEQFVADDGEVIHLKIGGEGPPLVLLHGWTSSHRDWNPFLEAFQAHFRVYRWDARAHGGHLLRTATVPTLERMACDLDNLMNGYGLRDALVVGHSMGALTLWQYLRRFGAQRLSRAVFIDQSPKLVTDEDWPHGIYGDFDWARNAVFMRELERDFAEAVLRLVADGLNAQARRDYLANGELVGQLRRRLRALDPRPLIDCWASLSAADLREVLPGLALPSLLVHGGESNFYTLETARYVGDHTPGAQLRVYAGVDHAPHLWRRERFVEDVLAFAGVGQVQACDLGG